MHPDAVYARYILSLFDSFLYNILDAEKHWKFYLLYIVIMLERND